MEDSSLSTSGGDTGSLMDTSDSDLMEKIVSNEEVGTDEESSLSNEQVLETDGSESEESSEKSSVSVVNLVGENPSSSLIDRVKNFEYSKAIQTIPAWITMFVCGLSLVVQPVTLKTMEEVVGAEGKMSWTVFFSRAIGVVIGSLVGGVITDFIIVRFQMKFKEKILVDRTKPTSSFITRQIFRFLFSVHLYILIIICLFIVFYMLVPLFPGFYTINIFMFLNGVCFGSAQCGAMVCVGWIWKEKTTVPMQIFQLHLGAGVVLFPYAMSKVLENFDEPSDELFYGYLISSIFSAAPILFLIFIPSPVSPELHVVKKEEEEEEELEEVSIQQRQEQQSIDDDRKEVEQTIVDLEDNDIDKKEEKEESESESVPKIVANLYWILIGLLYLFIAASEVILPGLYVKYMTYNDSELGLLDDDVNATWFLAMHYFLYLLSKIAVIVLVSFVPGMYLLGLNIFGSIICGILLVLFPRTLIIVRIVFIIVGWFVSPLFGLGFSIPVRYGVNMSGFGGACTIIGAAVGVAMISLVAFIMDKSGNYVSLFLSFFFFGIGSLIVLMISLFVGSWIKIKYILKQRVDIKLIWKNF